MAGVLPEAHAVDKDTDKVVSRLVGGSPQHQCETRSVASRAYAKRGGKQGGLGRSPGPGDDGDQKSSQRRARGPGAAISPVANPGSGGCTRNGRATAERTTTGGRWTFRDVPGFSINP